MADISDPTTWISTASGVLSFLKLTRDLSKDDKTKKELSEKIEKVEVDLEMARVQMAAALKYHLCQCTFPPQIMLSKGNHPRHDTEIFKCEKCGKQEPSETKINRMHGPINPSGRGGSWMGS